MFKELEEDLFLNALTRELNALGHKLYVVGGKVRDLVLGENRLCGDIDICGTVGASELKTLAEKLGAKAFVKNKKLNTCEIWVNLKKYEYAQMRVEKYNGKNAHNPSTVTFVFSVEEDAKRRDFTINSMYYDRYSTTLLDPLSGNQDLTSKILRAVGDPDITMKEDPSRILRLVELVMRLNFKIEEKTLLAAKKFSKNIYKLTEGRKKIEIDRIKSSYNNSKNKEESKSRLKKISKELGIFELFGEIIV